MTDTLHLPFMETRWEYNFKPSAFGISIHPHPSMLGQAFADFIRYIYNIQAAVYSGWLC